MKHFVQEQERFWWTKKTSYFTYFVREMSGALIALYVLTAIGHEAFSILLADNLQLAANLNDFRHSFPYYAIQYSGLAGELIHSISWLIIMPSISPFELSKKQQIAGIVILIASAAAFSYMVSVTFHSIQ